VTNARQASTTDGDAGPASIVTIGRTGMTPLRFKGQVQFQQSHALFGLTTKVTLWARSSGGFVVHLELVRGPDRQVFAKRVGTIEDALDYLGSLVRKVHLEPEPKIARTRRPVARDLASAFLARSRNRAAHTGFEQIVSEASTLWAAADAEVQGKV